MAAFKPDRSSQLYSAAIILTLYASFPFVAAYVLASNLWHRIFSRPKVSATASSPNRKTAIVTGGKMSKAYFVAKHLKDAGCRVVLVETHKYWMVASRFTSCIDRFITVPVPEQDPKGYLSALKQLAYEEDADLFVPVSSPVASIYDAQVGKVLPPSCRSLSTGEVWTAALDDKVTFNELAKQAGLPVPDTRRMTSKEAVFAFNDMLASREDKDATKYIFKNLQYDSMRRLDLFSLPCATEKLAAYLDGIDEVSTRAPWVCQAFMQGTEYSTCAIAHEGALALYTANVASISCFNYEHDPDPRLREWVETFCRTHKISGVVCIDFFIDNQTGKALAIECNPRFSSNIASFHNSPSVGRAYLEPQSYSKAGTVETPLSSAGETCWIGFEIYDALLGKGGAHKTLRERAFAIAESLFVKKDAYYDAADPWPFLALYYLHLPTLLARNIVRGNRWAKIDLCIGKLTEVNGD